MDILAELGHPPADPNQAPESTEPTGNRSNRGLSMASKRDMLLEISFQNYLEHAHLIDTSKLEAAEFFFAGPPTKAGVPVFYFIVRRFNDFILSDMNAMLLHFFKVCGESLSNPYALVVDMSWTTLSGETKSHVMSRLEEVLSVFSRNQKKNLESVYIVHPTSFVRNVLWVMRPFVSAKLRRKIFLVYEWKNLYQFISKENVRLPEESKNVVTRSYSVIKVNAKGKKQDRIIKLTANSLLNIEPKTKTIKNEKLFSQFEVEAIPGQPELVIGFSDDGRRPPVNMVGYFFSSKSTAEDLKSRRYLCESLAQRDAIIQDIFDAAMRATTVTLPQAFSGVEILHGKRKDRIFKFSCDSMMELKGAEILSDVHFDGIDSIIMDENNPNLLHFKFKFEDFTRSFESPQAKMFVQSLSEAIARNNEKERRKSVNFEEKMKSKEIKQAAIHYDGESEDEIDKAAEDFDDGGVFGSF